MFYRQEKSDKIYDKLVHSKASKGYVPDEDSSDYVYETDQVKTGIHCQLLNPIEEEALKELLENNEWWAQEKMDGRRMLIQKTDELTAINRKGFSIGAPQTIMYGMSLLENGKEVFVGNVTISPNKEVPKEREIIEVRYLYAYQGGSLYQPTFLHVRTDIEEQECLLSQLKFKEG